MAVTGPTIQRHKSSGDIWTPQDFRAAVTKRFGEPYFDLACSGDNMFASYGGYTPVDDSLKQSWASIKGLLWLNPPYANITPWAKKCAQESLEGARILLLVPGSIGANWYWQYVEPFADVYSVGRMTFDNCFDKAGNLVTTAYPKDLIPAHYHNAVEVGEHQKMQRWRWK
jgi:phage N-6-adenine-methyltransferase